SRAYIKEQIKLGNILIYPVRSLKIKPEIPQSEPPASLSLQRGEQAKSPQKLKIRMKYAWTSNGVNGKKVKPSCVLRESDQVAFAPGFEFPTENKIQPNPEIKLNIIFENKDVIVIDKLAGISVHPRQTKTGTPIAKEINNTLVSGLLAYYPPLEQVGDDPKIRPGIVHRLDKDTSGVMVVAKNQRSFDWLKKQFKERVVQKKYIALIHNCPKENPGVIKTYLTRSKTEPSKQKVISGTDKIIPRSNEREAITEYKIIKKFKDFCLIEAYPKTGRLHQIRVQFAWLGNPIAGDTKYGPRLRPHFTKASPGEQGYDGQAKKKLLASGLKRQFLHAVELKITLIDGEKKTFLSPLPDELAQIAERLKKN
ncbi:RluA family pseudouridine synthase, partial [Patescibacteria group bacterium]|nr:RluA family pseudouridine synthase [Patescibacteria group bacterium]